MDNNFERLLNFRDVGKTINQFLGADFLVEGRLFRSARPDDTSEADRLRLTQDHNITNVIDLRSKTEHLQQSQKRDVGFGTAAPIAPSNAVAALPLRIPGVQYWEISLNGAAYERWLMRQLSWSSLSKVLTLLLFGYRIEAIAIMGREVLLPLGLVGLGCTSIDHCGDEIRQILEIIILSPPSGLLIHCTQGKDRTGLIVVLILFLLDVPIDAIANDYALSESELRPESEERTKALIEIGLTAESAGAPVDWPKSIRTHVVEKYGGISEYLAHIGVNWDMQLAAKRNLARRQDES